MFLQGSLLLLGFTCFLALFQAAVGIECGPGEKVSLRRDKCEPCPPKQYRPKQGDYVECLNCVECKNSREVAPCTSIANTKCECWEGFSQLPGSKEVCRCNKGSGIEPLGNGENTCKPCPNGTFSNRFNGICQPWSKCDHNGIMVPGTNSFDVICQTTPKNAVTKVSALTSTPHPAIVTHQTSANASTMASTRTATTKKLVSTGTTKQMQLQHWLVPLSCVLALLLIQLAIIKLKVKTCFQKNKTGVIRQDSCGKPVEESGEKFIPPAV
ncbi:tumor necrosis factor receptor superfamily member 16-like [Astyanax mexicanus]|uniref:Tumor necrosis factor receptor superfamily member 16-like n=1 Tax=Astyanax mexicanus TaxID=7994 RepID=A0A8T2M0Z9_ASTMX|nr:tumor necrosis factor receptor superfamily member 16-like [Astyanax mexicanus]